METRHIASVAMLRRGRNTALGHALPDRAAASRTATATVAAQCSQGNACPEGAIALKRRVAPLALCARRYATTTGLGALDDLSKRIERMSGACMD